ncbi:hypothetical protein [Escherichia coli]|uniref:hypothetical protein n=1 Tax=Escherichia coli TaxID=562 RepID=UPI0037DBFAB5
MAGGDVRVAILWVILGSMMGPTSCFPFRCARHIEPSDRRFWRSRAGGLGPFRAAYCWCLRCHVLRRAEQRSAGGTPLCADPDA